MKFIQLKRIYSALSPPPPYTRGSHIMQMPRRAALCGRVKRHDEQIVLVSSPFSTDGGPLGKQPILCREIEERRHADANVTRL